MRSHQTANAVEEGSKSTTKDALAPYIAQALGGKHYAFEEIYRSTSRPLLLVVRKLCAVHAEDVLAETYLQAWRTLASFDPERCTVVGWLITIATSRARDRMRRERVCHGGADGAIEFNGDDRAYEGAGPEQLLLLDQQRRLLFAAMQSLRGKERWVLSLAFFLDQSHSEIAATTGMPLGTVKTLLGRSQMQLRGIMCPTPIQTGAELHGTQVETA